MKFNQRLIELRKQKGLSQEELGEKLGVARQTISKWELGETTPEMEKVIEISKFFEVSLNVLIGEEEYNNNPISNEPQKDFSDNSHDYNSIKVVIIIALLILIIVILILKLYSDFTSNILEKSKNNNTELFDSFFDKSQNEQTNNYDLNVPSNEELNNENILEENVQQPESSTEGSSNNQKVSEPNNSKNTNPIDEYNKSVKEMEENTKTFQKQMEESTKAFEKQMEENSKAFQKQMEERSKASQDEFNKYKEEFNQKSQQMKEKFNSF